MLVPLHTRKEINRYHITQTNKQIAQINRQINRQIDQTHFAVSYNIRLGATIPEQIAKYTFNESLSNANKRDEQTDMSGHVVSLHTE